MNPEQRIAEAQKRLAEFQQKLADELGVVMMPVVVYEEGKYGLRNKLDVGADIQLAALSSWQPKQVPAPNADAASVTPPASQPPTTVPPEMAQVLAQAAAQLLATPNGHGASPSPASNGHTPEG